MFLIRNKKKIFLNYSQYLHPPFLELCMSLLSKVLTHNQFISLCLMIGVPCQISTHCRRKYTWYQKLNSNTFYVDLIFDRIMAFYHCSVSHDSFKIEFLNY